MRFLAYTFNAAFGLFVATLSLLTVVAMAALFVLEKPTAFLLTLCVYVSIFGAAMLGSYLKWIHYRQTAPKIIKYNDRTGKMEQQYL